MKDRTFQGADVAAAMAAAEKALGVPARDLRYVVLRDGTAGGLGISPTPAEIAVLMEDGRKSSPAEDPAPPSSAPPPRRPGRDRDGDREKDRERPREAPRPPAGDPRDLVVKVLKALVEAAGIEIGVSVEEDPDTMKVSLSGPDHQFFLENDAEVLESLQYLLRRALPVEGFPRLVLECEGHREAREEGLRKTAQDLAAQVLADGAARSTPPLNSYERRIIHMTIAETRGLRTESVGEGADRRVTIKPVFPDDIE